MYKSSDSQIFRTTTGIQLGPDTFNKSKLVMTFLTNLGVTEILHRFKSVIEGKTGTLLSNLQRDAPFHHMAYDYSRANWDGLRDHLRNVPWEDIFKLIASAAASEFCEWVQVGIDVYIPHCQYHANPHSSPWFQLHKLLVQLP